MATDPKSAREQDKSNGEGVIDKVARTIGKASGEWRLLLLKSCRTLNSERPSDVSGKSAVQNSKVGKQIAIKNKNARLRSAN